MDVLRTGIDLVEVQKLAELKDRIRQRFIARVYTPGEAAWAGDADVRLAELFAVKEAAAKALGCGIGEAAWQDFEVVFEETGEPGLKLSGVAAEIASRLGVSCWWVSISHTPALALAWVAAS